MVNNSINCSNRMRIEIHAVVESSNYTYSCMLAKSIFLLIKLNRRYCATEKKKKLGSMWCLYVSIGITAQLP